MSASRAVYDPLAGESVSATTGQQRDDGEAQKPPKFFEWFSPSALLAYEEPEGYKLVGDYHIQRGAIAVLAGASGIGKSRAALWLAIQGAKGEGDWFGLKVHRQFRTLMLQAENGLPRLHNDFEEIQRLGALDFGPTGLDAWLRVCKPPELGMQLGNPLCHAELCATINEFAPQLLIVDPWNRVAPGDQEKDYKVAFDWIARLMVSAGGENLACLIVHHSRKPKAEDRARGVNLIHLMAGSYTMASVPRSVMMLQRASEDGQDKHVVFTTVKDNDGRDWGKRKACDLRDGSFFEAEDFDWNEFDAGGGAGKKGPAVNEEHIRAVFDDGGLWLSQKDATEKLQELAQVGRSTAYDALKVIGGRFSAILWRRDDGAIGLAERDG